MGHLYFEVFEGLVAVGGFRVEESIFFSSASEDEPFEEEDEEEEKESWPV